MLVPVVVVCGVAVSVVQIVAVVTMTDGGMAAVLVMDMVMVMVVMWGVPTLAGAGPARQAGQEVGAACGGEHDRPFQESKDPERRSAAVERDPFNADRPGSPTYIPVRAAEPGSDRWQGQACLHERQLHGGGGGTGAGKFRVCPSFIRLCSVWSCSVLALRATAISLGRGLATSQHAPRIWQVATAWSAAGSPPADVAVAGNSTRTF